MCCVFFVVVECFYLFWIGWCVKVLFIIGCGWECLILLVIELWFRLFNLFRCLCIWFLGFGWCVILVLLGLVLF